VRAAVRARIAATAAKAIAVARFGFTPAF
jgi:hypothetical protein